MHRDLQDNPGGAALRASLDTICAGIPTPELPTTDDDSGGSGEGGAEGVRATLLSIISATVLAVATTAAFCWTPVELRWIQLY